MCNPDYIFRTAPEAFGRWSAPQRKCFSNVSGGGQVEKYVFTRFLTVIMGSHTFFNPPSPINRLHFLKNSHTFFFLLFYNDVFPSLAFHRKRPLWKFIWGHMIGQHGRGQSRYEVGLSRRKFDHHCLLLRRGPCPPSNSKATGMSYQQHCFLPPPPPPRNSFRFLCKKLQHL